MEMAEKFYLETWKSILSHSVSYYWGKVKVELDLSNYARKVNLTNARGVDTSKFAKEMI